MGKFHWGSLFRGRRGESAAPRERERGIDTALVIEAARVAVTTRVATCALIERRLSVTEPVAEELLDRLEHCEVVRPHEAGRSRAVLATSGDLPGLVEEFQRRA